MEVKKETEMSHQCVQLSFIERNRHPIMNRASKCPECQNTSLLYYEDYQGCHRCGSMFDTNSRTGIEPKQRFFRFDERATCPKCRKSGMKRFPYRFQVQCVHCNVIYSIN